MKTGIIIGRFQVRKLHLGHIYLISNALQECDKVVILLGCVDLSSEYDREKNPYSSGEITERIKKVFPQVDIMYLFDKESDEKWSRQVDMLCDEYENPILYHSRDSFISHYSGKLPSKEIPELEGYSGTKVRKEYPDG